MNNKETDLIFRLPKTHGIINPIGNGKIVSSLRRRIQKFEDKHAETIQKISDVYNKPQQSEFDLILGNRK